MEVCVSWLLRVNVTIFNVTIFAFVIWISVISIRRLQMCV